MSSPFVPASFSYGDLPQGGQLTPIVVAARAPSNTTDKQYQAGYFWLSSLDMYQIVGGVPVYGNGNLYYQAGNSAGTPNWVLVSDASGSIVGINGTTNQITVSISSGVATLTIPATFIAPGSIASTTTIAAGTALSSGTTIIAGTSITATLGNITATNGNIVRGTAGNKDVYSSVATTTTAGANSAGTVTLVGGTATVSTTAVTASSQIRLYRQGIGATGAAALGIITLGTVTASTSFVINAVQAANATALQASDVSVIGWEIVN